MNHILEIVNLEKRFPGEDRGVVNNVSLKVIKGELLALVGESGSGKTSLLRLVAGLDYLDKGDIIINGEVVAGKNVFIPPEKRNVGLVFQDFALFPHMTVSENIVFGLKGKPKNEKKIILSEMLEMVGLKGFENKYPHQLSGGEQQRVALARALAPKPAIMLLDEPFSSLDESKKFQMRTEVKRILKAAGVTTILVTHDTKDALAIADRIAIIREGKMQQVDEPVEIYSNPLNAYVSEFFGKINLFESRVSEGKIQSIFGPIEINNPAIDKIQFSLRPENIEICNDKKDSYSGILENVIYAGDHLMAELIYETKEGPVSIYIKSTRDFDFTLGEEYNFRINKEKIHILQPKE